MASTGKLITSLLCLVVLTEAKLLIRLRSGSECPMEGYFRDVVDCAKFYFCPDPSFPDTFLTPQEKQIFWEMTSGGVTCPEGSIFDESIPECRHISLVKSVPPECVSTNLIEKQPKRIKSFGYPKSSKGDF